MASIKFDYETIRALRIPPDKNMASYCQPGVPGLQLIIKWKPDVIRSKNIPRDKTQQFYRYLWRYRFTITKELGNRERENVQIGEWPALSAAKAIAYSRVLRDQARSGVDPRSLVLEARAKRIGGGHGGLTSAPLRYQVEYVFEKLKSDWLTTGKSPGTIIKYEQSLERYLFKTHGQKDIRGITGLEWDNLINEIANIDGKVGAANNLHKAGRRLFSYALEQGYIKYNPLLQRRKTLNTVRLTPDSTFMDSEQLHEFLNSVDSLPISQWAIVNLKLMLMVGVRVEEWKRVKVGWIKFKNKRIEHPGHAMKNGKDAWTHLSDDALAVLIEWLKIIKDNYGPLENEWYLFPSPDDPQKQNKTHLSKELILHRPFPGFTPKILRKTISTHLQRQGCPPTVLRAIRNQTVVDGVEAHYDFDNLFHFKKQWIDKWSELLAEVKSNPKALVVDKDSILDDQTIEDVKDLFL